MASASSNGQMIGRFRITKALGRGAQGAVFLAHDPSLDRPVAIKLVGEIPKLQNTGQAVSQQARNLAQLRHPNIIAIYESGQFHNFTYLVFEYLEGVPLREELTQRGALPLADAYSTMSQVTDAMAYAHAKGIVHLDLNPNNIMRDESGKPRVMDFDLSRKIGQHEDVKLIAGTIPYMAPEQFLTQTSDQRSDVFALGRILYECLTGKRAMPNGTRQEIITFIHSGKTDLEPLRAVDPTGAFTEVVVRATARDPSKRYQNAREMHDALRQAWDIATRDAQHAAVVHGTVAFVMKRIERKGDFPAISRTLAEVNKLTGEANNASVAQLTNVVLRDYALTNRLLKLANSSYFSRGSGNVKTVSDAIKLLGLEQVRLACNSLACFGHFSGKHEKGLRIREEAIASFIAGLVARHLAVHMKVGDAEEAFLAAMLFNLGRMLALYYFTDDFADIEALINDGADELSAARTVLGTTLPEIGHGVGQTWGLPPAALACMVDENAANESRSLTAIVRFANRLTAVTTSAPLNASTLLVDAQSLAKSIDVPLATVVQLLDAATQKFASFAPALEVDAGNSACLRRLNAWINDVNETLAAAAARADTEAPHGQHANAL